MRSSLVVAFGAAALSTAAAADSPWIQPIVGPELVARADSIEKTIRSHAEQPAPRGVPWLRVEYGTAPVVVTAPHATNPMRKGQLRFSDKGTGSLAEVLHEAAGATVVYTTWASPRDPNETDSSAFKDTLAALLAKIKPVAVIDLHSSHPARPYDVDFGTMKGLSVRGNPALLRDLSGLMTQHGLYTQSRDFFSAGDQRTVTRFVAGHGFSCVQLEINAVWLRAGGTDLDKHRFAQIANALAVYVRSQGGQTGAGGTDPAGGHSEP